jgi:5'-AMP-activated protein kinase regulatory beta subunit
MSIKRDRNGVVTFICNSGREARQVYLAGSFNDWNPKARRMVKVRDGSFRARMELEPGHYEYKFVVDGVWVHDPEVEQQAWNEFGSMNSLVQI